MRLLLLKSAFRLSLKSFSELYKLVSVTKILVVWIIFTKPIILTLSLPTWCVIPTTSEIQKSCLDVLSAFICTGGGHGRLRPCHSGLHQDKGNLLCHQTVHSRLTRPLLLIVQGRMKKIRRTLLNYWTRKNSQKKERDVIGRIRSYGS